MKNAFITFALTFALATGGFAQSKSCSKGHCLKGDVGYVSLSIGPSIPVGNFADNNINNLNAGFAKAGYKFEISGGYNITPVISLNARGFYSSHSYDAGSLLNKYTSENPGTTFSSTARNWDIYGGMIGVSYSHPVTRKFTADVKLLSGFMQTSIPKMTIAGNNGSSVTESEKSATSFVYLLSVGGHYPLGRLIDLVGNLEYLSSSPTFSNVQNTSYLPAKNLNGNQSQVGTSTSKQDISLLALNFGVRVKF